ncbi:S-protein homolog 3-like [Brassica napus]|uniref:S-protein homolog 3-like n=1 Tax=Brassica napus TaxID=3708 RepID=UPI000BBE32A1|nr:S-protein homolog 3-like [Brassica napus]
MKKWQVYVVVISLFVHLVASQVETITEGRTGEITNKLFDGIRGKRTVEIINKLGGGLTLTLHCKSKDDDLGVQTLAPDSRWSFNFIEEEDLLRFMIKEEVDLVFPMFDGAAETGKIIRKAFTEWVNSYCQDRPRMQVID